MNPNQSNLEADNVSHLNKVVDRPFICPRCDTIFYCNRAEPYCKHDHPGQYHLQRIEWSANPCEQCETWRKPWEESELRYETDPGDETVLMFPPPGILAED